MPAALYGLVRKRGRNAAVNEMVNINVLFIMKFVTFCSALGDRLCVSILTFKNQSKGILCL